MSTVLEAPVTDRVLLEETFLEATVPCRYPHSEASWRWATRCCNAEAFFCDQHDAAGVENATKYLSEPGVRQVCPHCMKSLGMELDFDQVYRRHQI